MVANAPTASGCESRSLNALDEGVASLRSILLPTAVFGFAVNLLLFTSPLYMMQIYDRVLTSRSGATLVALSLIALFLVGLMGLLELVRSRVLVRAGMKFDDLIGSQLFDAVGAEELRSPRGSAVQYLADAGRVREFITGNGILGFLDAPWTPLFVLVCFIIHPVIGCIALFGALAVLGLAYVSELATKDPMMEASAAARALAVSAAEAFQNIESAYALGMRGIMRARWLQSRGGLMEKQAIVSDRAGAIQSVSKFVRVMLQIGVLGVGAWLAVLNEISPGALIAASMLMGRAMAPVDQAVANWKGFVAARASFSRLKELFARQGEEAQRIELPAPKGHLTVSGLTLVPPGAEKPVLKNVSFSVEPGEVVAVVGPSAAGKSSLVRALTGIWIATEGSVRIDGYEISQFDPDMLGKHVGYLPQDVEMFRETVAANISRLTGGDDAEVIEAAQAAGIHEAIQQFPDGYATVIGQGGLTLSGGQRQRIALARALYGKPCLLVMDEPNSNLDSAGETALIGAIRSAKEAGTAVIVTTHKLNLLTVADKILVLVNGTVHQFGPKNQVLPLLVGGRQAGNPQIADTTRVNAA